MSLELANTLATFGTFIVIAATAIAAVVQLRHARTGNIIAALNELSETTAQPHYETAAHIVSTQLAAKLQDPAFRYQIATPAARTDEMRPFWEASKVIGNFYENMGLLVKAGLVDQALVMQMWVDSVIPMWEQIAPVVAIQRRGTGNAIWEHFEYLAVFAEDWHNAHPKGTYPAGVRRLSIKDEWLEADRQYANSLRRASS